MEWVVYVPFHSRNGSVSHYYPLEAQQLRPHVAAYLQNVPHIGTSNNCFIGNASRLYADVGHARESTTPEATSHEDTTASEIAGEDMMYDIVTTPADIDGELAQLDDFRLNKRVVSDSFVHGRLITYGYHESYNVPSNVLISENGLALLGIHLATRNVFAGAGFLDADGRFWSSQKGVDMHDDYSTATSGQKPVVNLRDEKHSNDNSSRVHVTSGDPHMDPWATQMQLGTTQLVLDMIANGTKAAEIDFKPASHERGLALFMRTLAADATGNSELFALALNAQGQLMKLAKNMNLNKDQQWVIEEWERVLGELGENPHLARDRVEWVLRRERLEHIKEKHGVSWSSAVMLNADHRWDRIGPGSIGQRLRQDERAWAPYMPPESLIEARRPSGRGPDTTRAGLRSNFIHAMHSYNSQGSSVVSVDWSVLKYRNITITLKPSETYNPRLDKLIKTSRPEAA